MLDFTSEHIFAIYEQLKDRYPVIMSMSSEVDDGFTTDVPILVGKAHGQIIWLYEDGGLLILDVLDEAKNKGTHWHPNSIIIAVDDIAEFMDGKSDYVLVPFRNQ